MRKIRIRISLTSENCVSTPIYESGADPGDDDKTEVNVVPTLSPLIPAAYDFSRYAHPAVRVALSVPDDDLGLMHGWLGIAPAVPGTPSDTLVKRMTESVTSMLRKYYADMQAAGLFTSPFRFGHALRRADGSHFARSAVSLMQPDASAPRLPVREAEFSGNNLTSVTEILNSPAELRIAISPFVPSDNLRDATHLDIVCTRPVGLLRGDEKVSAIRTMTYAGENCRAWYYDRITESDALSAALADSDFRIVASLPLTQLAAGIDSLRIPAEGDTLNWDSLPKLIDPIPSDPEYKRVRLTTAPLHLGDPESAKRVRALTVRGIFERRFAGEGDDIEVRLYASHHRERWHLMARSRGPHLRLLRAASFRWWLVEIEAKKSAQFDALTFELLSC